MLGTMLSGSPPFVIPVLFSWRREDHLGCDPRCQSTFHLDSVHGKQSEEYVRCVPQHKMKPTFQLS